MSVNHANEFFEYILYPKTFLAEGHMACIVLFLKKKISNLKFISFLTYIFRKWVRQLEFQKTGLLYYAVYLGGKLNGYVALFTPCAPETYSISYIGGLIN